MEIREASAADTAAIAGLNTESWRNTYNRVLSEKYLELSVPKERDVVWKSRLDGAKNNQIVLVAEIDNSIVGPDGSVVLTYWFVWEETQDLINNAM